MCHHSLHSSDLTPRRRALVLLYFGGILAALTLLGVVTVGQLSSQ